jgi:hypothetical protein
MCALLHAGGRRDTLDPKFGFLLCWLLTMLRLAPHCMAGSTGLLAKPGVINPRCVVC